MLFKCAGTTDSTSDGDGMSIIIYFQGCNKNCKNCHNSDLQDPNGGKSIDTNDLVKDIEKMTGFYKSVVFSGGDPLEQPEALLELASKLKLRKFLYTGELFENIPSYILNHIDVVIDGPYDESKKTGKFPASSNQRIYEKINNDVWVKQQ